MGVKRTIRPKILSLTAFDVIPGGEARAYGGEAPEGELYLGEKRLVQLVESTIFN